MAGKLIELEEAAKLLGVTPAELNQMRMSGEVHGVRDGSEWKFKMEELERVAEERGVALGGAPVSEDSADGLTVSEDSGDLLNVGSLEADEGEESDLDLEMEAGEAEDSPTAIGSLEQFETSEAGESGLALSEEPEQDDDLTIGDDEEVVAPGGSDVLGETGGSDVGLGLDSDKNVLDDSGTSLSDVALVPDDSGSGLDLVADSSADVLSGTDVRLDGTGTGPGTGTGSGVGSDELDFEGSDIGVVSDLALEGDQDLALSEDEEDELTIGDEEELALGEEDELVLEGGSGSDVTGGAGDSGINLTSPSDSGLNLEEEPLDLVGSSVSSLELPEDEDMIDLEDLEAGPDEATQLKVDEDFQLEPGMEAEVEDEEDSGSQVIALEDSEAFEQAGAAVGEVQPIVSGEADELEGALDQAEVAPVTQPALPEGAYLPERPEMPYTVWNVISLLAIVLLLAFTGMLMTDLVRNMWTWEGPYTASTPLMDLMVRLLGWEP